MRSFHLHFGRWYPPDAAIPFNFAPCRAAQLTWPHEEQGGQFEAGSTLWVAVPFDVRHEPAYLPWIDKCGPRSTLMGRKRPSKVARRVAGDDTAGDTVPHDLRDMAFDLSCCHQSASGLDTPQDGQHHGGRDTLDRLPGQFGHDLTFKPPPRLFGIGHAAAQHVPFPPFPSQIVKKYVFHSNRPQNFRKSGRRNHY